MKILVTGASGFVGSALVSRLCTQPEHVVHGTVRQGPVAAPNMIAVGSICAQTDWKAALEGVDTVVHLAARAHVLNARARDELAEFRRVNVEGALALARQCVEAGVRRFVFVSSIGVNVAEQVSAIPYTEHSAGMPHAAYAVSKLEAEQGLRAMLDDGGVQLVIVRPPLVYAGHAPGNFQRLMKLVASGVPLPFASLRNQRSMVALENLVDFLAVCVEHPDAAGELFLVADGIEVSTPQIVRYLADGMGRKARLLPMPDAWLRLGAGLLGKRALYAQLCQSLLIDCSKARSLLDWTPPVAPDVALRAAGAAFLRTSQATDR